MPQITYSKAFSFVAVTKNLELEKYLGLFDIN